ncbi:uncharacterized protein LOC144355166 [Saccoglossus kowalevskii]
MSRPRPGKTKLVSSRRRNPKNKTDEAKTDHIDNENNVDTRRLSNENIVVVTVSENGDIKNTQNDRPRPRKTKLVSSRKRNPKNKTDEAKTDHIDNENNVDTRRLSNENIVVVTVSENGDIENTQNDRSYLKNSASSGSIREKDPEKQHAEFYDLDNSQIAEHDSVKSYKSSVGYDGDPLWMCKQCWWWLWFVVGALIGGLIIGIALGVILGIPVSATNDDKTDCIDELTACIEGRNTYAGTYGGLNPTGAGCKNYLDGCYIDGMSVICQKPGSLHFKTTVSGASSDCERDSTNTTITCGVTMKMITYCYN